MDAEIARNQIYINKFLKLCRDDLIYSKNFIKLFLLLEFRVQYYAGVVKLVDAADSKSAGL